MEHFANYFTKLKVPFTQTVKERIKLCSITFMNAYAKNTKYIQTAY